jgi:septal ring factor EnvC (AmiA/AmiB activator)
VTAAVAERLTETLDAALVDPGAAQLLRSGRLASALRHVGFGVVDETGQPAQIPTVKAAAPRTIRSKPAPAAKKPARKAPTDDEVLLRRRKELEDLVAEADAEYDEAEAERAKAESELDANEHHLADMRTALERLNDELERVRQELKQAQGQMPRLERRLKIATRAAEKAARRRASRRQRLDNSGS